MGEKHMPRKQCAVSVLAAGKGTRLKLSVPKALAPVMGKKLIDFTLEGISEFASIQNIETKVGVVIGHQKELVAAHLESSDGVETCVQEQQNGTGDALKSFINAFPQMMNSDYLIVTCADTPLITAEVYSQMYVQMNNEPELEAIAVSFETQNPYGYGRIVRKNKGFVIIEESDADNDQKQIKEVNSGLYIFRPRYVAKFLSTLENKNSSGEFYITDLFKEGENVRALPYKDKDIFLGVNTQSQLEEARLTLQLRKVEQLRNAGVYFEDSRHSYIDWDVQIGSGSKIAPNCYLRGNTQIGQNVEIEPGVIIKNSTIGDSSAIYAHSYLEGATIEESVNVGPFARIRPATIVATGAKVGNFVEIKKSHLKAGAKVSHLSYIGDAEIGENTNIGCGFITCNYDGKNKHKTIIGKDSFIGSDCQTIAPVNIGSGSFVAAGSTITSNVPDNSFAISRGRQETKEGIAKRFIKK
jgi:bifunctional UDP-N-acetylglucosamine pyrophosphorylase/glucosamine-1-phosphate N-acetyltransferase